MGIAETCWSGGAAGCCSPVYFESLRLLTNSRLFCAVLSSVSSRPVVPETEEGSGPVRTRSWGRRRA